VKEATFGQLLRDVIGGTPAEVAVKLLIAALALLWNNLAVIGAAVFIYFLMLVIDAVMGAMLAIRKGGKWSSAFFIRGPFKKFALTAGMLFVAALVDSMVPDHAWIPDTPIFIAVASFVGITTLLDVARKYGALTGSQLIKWLEAKLGNVIKVNDDEVGV
jgi:hypothetical protein